MSKATPGPWHLTNVGQVRDANDSMLASVCNFSGATKQWRDVYEIAANAALIAAAPDLLVAGQRTFDSIESLIFNLEHNAPGVFSQAEIIEKLRWLISDEALLGAALSKASAP